MSREQLDGEDSVVETGTNRYIDATAETEVELLLPLEVDMEPDRIRTDIPLYPTVLGLDFVGPDPVAQSRFKPPNGAKPKWARQGLRLPCTPESRRQLPEDGAQPAKQ